MANLSKQVDINGNVIKRAEYSNMYQDLNHPLTLSHYKEGGCLMMKRDGKLIILKTELEEYRIQEADEPNIKHLYTLEFIPFNMFKLVKTDNGIRHCANDEV